MVANAARYEGQASVLDVDRLTTPPSSRLAP